MSVTPSVWQLSELSAAELASAHLSEHPPEVAVLQESPPSSPPRPQLYPTPQVSSVGGRGWRGRAGRSWRGRGAGGNSSDRPAPYSTPRRNSGGRGLQTSASPVLRTAPTVSPRTWNGSGNTARSAGAALSSVGLFSRSIAADQSTAAVPPHVAPKHKSDAISETEIDAMFDDDDDVLFGQL